MISLGLSSWGVRTRVIVLAILPIVIVAVMLGYYTIDSRTQEIRAALDARGNYIVNNIAPACEFGVVTRNESIIANIVDSVLREEDIVYMGVYDNAGATLYENGRDQNAVVINSAVADKSVLTFRAPVYSTTIQQDELNRLLEAEGGGQENEIIGWVRIVVSTDDYVAREQTVIRNTLIIIFAGIIISLLFALFIGNSVIAPITQIMSAVAALTRGELSSRITVDEGGEIGELQQGINGMAGKIEQSHAELETRVARAVSELQDTVDTLKVRNTELKQARREAMLAKDAKSEFLANMSHEIRTPLNAVIGFSRQLARTAHDNKQLEYTRTISRAATQLLTVIDDILSFSKLDSGNIQIKNTEFSIREYLEDTVMMLSPAAHDKHLELVLLIDSDIPERVTADPLRITQVLTNLVNNAIKFTDKGSIVVHARMDGDETDGNIIVSVIDTGIGMGDRAQQELFRPFYQEDTTASRKRGGTGLGLIISKRLVEMMGGELTFESEQDKGTTFTMSIPVSVVSEFRHPTVGLPEGSSVMLLDMHPQSRRAIRNSLVHMGIRTFVHASFDSLLDALSVNHIHPDTTLVMLSLPPGFDVSHIREDYLEPIREYYPGNILMLVGDEDGGLAAMEGESPGYHLLTKPVRLSVLQREIMACFGETGSDEFGDEQVTTGQLDSFAGLKVLVAEDNEFNRLYIKDMLQNYDIEPVCVVNGRDAIDECMREEFDIVFLDLHMPDIDGIEAVSIIRGMGGLHAVMPIVAITADVFANDDNALTRKGFTDCLFKPIDEDSVVDVIIRECRRGDGREVVSDEQGEDTVASATRLSNKLPGELVGKLIENLRLHSVEIEADLDNHDMEAARKNVHKLQGLICYFELDSLNTSIDAIQRAVRQNQVQEARYHLVSLKELVEKIVEQLRAEHGLSR